MMTVSKLLHYFVSRCFTRHSATKLGLGLKVYEKREKEGQKALS